MTAPSTSATSATRALIALAVLCASGGVACKKKERVDVPVGQSSSVTSSVGSTTGAGGGGGGDAGTGGGASTSGAGGAAAADLAEACDAFCGLDPACESSCQAFCRSTVPAGCEEEYAAYYACVASDSEGVECQGGAYVIPGGRCPDEAAALDCP